MAKTALYIKSLTGVLTGMISALFGVPDALFWALIVCISADYITGICSAIYQKNIDSRTGFVGILKKIVILIIVALSHTVGEVVGIPAIRDMVIGFYIANEGITVLENAGKMNIKYTDKLKKFLSQLNDSE